MVPLARELPGVKVAELLAELYVTVPVTAVPPCAASVKVVAVMVDGFIAVLKVAVTVDVTATPVAPLVGETAVTVGALGGGVPDPPPPHPARIRDALTSHQPEWNRITDLSFRIVGDGGIALSNLQPR